MEIFWIDGAPSGRLATATRPRGDDWLTQDLKSAAERGVTMIASMLTPPEIMELGLMKEADAACACGLHFLSVPIEDRGTPERVFPFVEAVHRAAQELLAAGSVAVHCRMGVGRSSMFAAATLVNLGVDPDAAWAMIAQARGRPVPDVAKQRDWLRDSLQFFEHE